ncbi:hypothetical protein PVAG01_10490 [Phlyctema vagabunda]|uniref:Glycosyltransferase family 92 protein n=1 Tax=Phlyctema vagabunda TaxID=108571 RepID=A0ABR4P2E5_9HELO
MIFLSNARPRAFRLLRLRHVLLLTVLLVVARFALFRHDASSQSELRTTSTYFGAVFRSHRSLKDVTVVQSSTEKGLQNAVIPSQVENVNPQTSTDGRDEMARIGEQVIIEPKISTKTKKKKKKRPASASKTVATATPDPATSNIETMSDEEYVAICICIKDQREELAEFLVHHYHHLGIRRFYIWDDGSEPPLSTIEDLGIPKSVVTFNYQERETRKQRMQTIFYNKCLKTYGAKHHWMAFIDADEYMEVTSQNETLREILEEFEKFDNIGGLGVSWRMHTSAGFIKQQPSTRKAFTTCIFDGPEHGEVTSDNHLVKSIVRPSKTDRAGNPHWFYMKDKALTVGEHWDEVVNVSRRADITRDRLAVHHYALKSRDEYELKMQRGSGQSNHKGWDFWNRIESLPTVECTEMARFNP